ncbi:MAG: restriction endonuclease subunit S [Flavobacteriales bacterium]|nr:restriction endonuclease subunit S [Flavobacteriales bacterium]
MNFYDTYQSSSIDCRPEIPESWGRFRLAYNGNFFKGKGIPKADLTSEGLPAFIYGDIYTKYDTQIKTAERYIPKQLAEYSVSVEAGDILFAASGETAEEIGKAVCYTGIETAYAGGDVIIYRQQRFDSVFLSYLFNSYHLNVQKAKLAKGEIVVHIYPGQLRDIPFTAPIDRKEQSTIAAYLDRKTAEIDALIADKKRLLELYAEEKTAIINQAVTKGIDRDATMKSSGIEWLGDVPEHWEVKRIRHIAKVFGRIGFRGYKTSDLVPIGQGAITISPSNMKEYHMDFENCTYLSWEKYEESPEIMIDNGDILFVKTGSTYGKVSFVADLPEKATINPQIIVFKEVSCDSNFLWYVLKSLSIRHQVETTVVGGTIPTIGQGKIMNYFLPMPVSLVEQRNVVEHIQVACKKVDSKISKTQKLIALLTEYRTALISEVVTGKVRVA